MQAWPERSSRSTKAARSSTWNAGCALRAGTNPCSTPRCTFTAPAANQQPPRVARFAGFSLFCEAEEPGVEGPRLGFAAGRHRDLHVVEGEDRHRRGSGRGRANPIGRSLVASRRPLFRPFARSLTMDRSRPRRRCRPDRPDGGARTLALRHPGADRRQAARARHHLARARRPGPHARTDGGARPRRRNSSAAGTRSTA